MARQGRGAFALSSGSRHDVVWLCGWALLTLNPWAFLLPVVATVGFVVLFIPQLSVHLAGRYGDDYAAWAASTKKLIPFIY